MSVPGLPGGMARLIDHTLLRGDATLDDLERLAGEAVTHGFRAVCVNPSAVRFVAGLLAKTDVLVASVVGFPLGATLPSVKAFEAARCVEAGAAELDLVVNVGLLRSGAWRVVAEELDATRGAIPPETVLKVILEMPRLDPGDAVRGALLARDHGAQFVKTSTGFAGSVARLEDVRRLDGLLKGSVGIKAAGGIRTYADARAFVDAGATRIGTSAGVAIVREEREAARTPGT